MGKVNLLVKYCLINKENEYNIKGILINKELKFLDNNNIMILNLGNNTLKRITKDSKILFDFNKNECIILDDKNNTISFNINVLEFIKNDNYFYVKYCIVQEEVFEIMIKIL